MTIAPAKKSTYFRPKFLKPKTRIFTDLRKVFVKSSVHFRPKAFRHKFTLARALPDRSFSPSVFPEHSTLRKPLTGPLPQIPSGRISRRYTESPICAPTRHHISPKTIKTAASVHKRQNPRTDAPEHKEIRIICLIFTCTSYISGEM